MQHPLGLPGPVGVLFGLTLPTGLDCACCTQGCQPPQSSQALAGFPLPSHQKGRGVEGAGGAIGLPSPTVLCGVVSAVLCSVCSCQAQLRAFQHWLKHLLFVSSPSLWGDHPAWLMSSTACPAELPGLCSRTGCVQQCEWFI